MIDFGLLIEVVKKADRGIFFDYVNPLSSYETGARLYGEDSWSEEIRILSRWRES